MNNTPLLKAEIEALAKIIAQQPNAWHVRDSLPLQ